MAKILSTTQRIGIAILKHKVKKVLRRYRKEFKDIMDVNGVKTDYKFPLFLVYFVQQVALKNVKLPRVLKELDEKGVIASYVRLSRKMDANENDSDVSSKHAAHEFANTLIKFIGEKKTDLDKNKVSDLVYNIIKLIKLTDSASQFELSAEKNLKENYENKVNTAINVTKIITNVQTILTDYLPEDSNDLIVIINNIIRKLFK